MTSKARQIIEELMKESRRKAESVYQKRPYDELSKSRKIKSSRKRIKKDRFATVFQKVAESGR